jgi:hypothetical protein
MDFFVPERAETRPPEDILKWYSPWASFVIVTGRRLETTMRCCSGGASGLGETGWESEGLIGCADMMNGGVNEGEWTREMWKWIK